MFIFFKYAKKIFNFATNLVTQKNAKAKVYDICIRLYLNISWQSQANNFQGTNLTLTYKNVFTVIKVFNLIFIFD